jgi:DNA-binding HxlR family transcriptional regulator
MAQDYPLANRAECSVFRALDVLGDHWSILILRELFLGVHRFDQLQDHLGIARNVLAARLRRLVAADVLIKRAYQTHPPRYDYRLTPKGLDLYPVLVGLMQWGDRYASGTGGGPVRLEHKACGHTTSLVLACADCGESVSPRDMRVVPRPARPAAVAN